MTRQDKTCKSGNCFESSIATTPKQARECEKRLDNKLELRQNSLTTSASSASSASSSAATNSDIEPLKVLNVICDDNDPPCTHSTTARTGTCVHEQKCAFLMMAVKILICSKDGECLHIYPRKTCPELKNYACVLCFLNARVTSAGQSLTP